jgi:hypothetical protein
MENSTAAPGVGPKRPLLRERTREEEDDEAAEGGGNWGLPGDEDMAMPSSNKVFKFEIPGPSDRRVDAGQWDITLHAEQHEYTVIDLETGQAVPGPFTSVTSFTHSLFPAFVPDVALRKMSLATKRSRYPGMTNVQIKQWWVDNGAASACLGTQMHSVMEVLLSRGDPFRHNFVVPPPRQCEHGVHARDETDAIVVKDDHVNALLEYLKRKCLITVVAIEQCVFDPILRMPGTIDLVLRNSETGRLHICDYKRYPKFTMTNEYGEKGLPGTVAESMPKCNASEATIQLNIYREQYRRCFGEDAEALHIFCMHPSLRTFEDHQMPVDDALVARLVEERMKQLRTGM